MATTDQARSTVRQRLETYLRLAGSLTLGEFLLRGTGFVTRRFRRQKLRLLDRYRCTYGLWSEVVLRPVFHENTPPLISPLPDHVLRAYLDHRFDLLGSGWQMYRREGSLKFASECNRRYASSVQAAIGAGPLGLADYEPIEWNVDVKSGHRWASDTHFSRIAISPGPGIDIKMPWELSRMQHLVQLAIAAESVDVDMVLAREIRAQILDFIASNPPRYGVTWACPMDIAIRVANWVLAVEILRSKGFTFDKPFLEIFVRSIADHAAHILAHLEWSELPRSNHYLANVTGLLFAAVSLGGVHYTNDWLGFATREFLKELRLQFHDDGGCYEASSGYHRLSAEMAVYGTALLMGVDDLMQSAIARPHARLPVRPHQSTQPLRLHEMTDGSRSLVPPEIFRLIAAMGDLSVALTRSTGLAVMIGDQDSGRFCKPSPAWSLTDGFWLEDSRDHRHLNAAISVLFTPSPATTEDRGAAKGIDAALVLALTRGRSFSARNSAPARIQNSYTGFLEKFGDPTNALLSPQSRNIFINFKPGNIEQASAFPQFGAYVLAGDGFHLCIRCFDPRLAGVYGHSHDDNLGIDLEIAGEAVITDPGTYLYTSDLASRDLYRSADAHFVPRVMGRNAMSPVGPFVVRHDAFASCLYFGSDGFVGRLDGSGWFVQRSIRLAPNGLEIVDTCEGGELAPLASAREFVRVTSGYGRKTERSICIV